MEKGVLRLTLEYIEQYLIAENTLNNLIDIMKGVGELRYRIKSFASCIDKIECYRRNEGRDVQVKDIHDFIGLRIICDDADECKEMTESIETVLLEYRTKKETRDYIEAPKDSGYQAIHTYYKMDGVKFEIQCMTQEMEDFAEESHRDYELSKQNHCEALVVE